MGKDQDLLDAARTGNVATIEKLLSARPKNAITQAIAISLGRSVGPNCQDASGYTPLHHAVLNGHKLAVEVLLKHDASPGLPDNMGSTPFHLAAWTGGTEMIEILLSHSRSYSHINEQNNDWDTPLHFASQYGHTSVVLILLENGVDPNISNKKEEMALDLAAQYGRLEATQLLLSRRPDLLFKIPQRRSILHLAARNGHPLVIKALLEAGCDINKKLKTGSALHEAALFGKVEAVRVLLEHQPPISIHIKDMTGETALQKVEGYPSKVAIEIAAMIKAHSRGLPLPPPSTTPDPLRRLLKPADAEQRSTYDNVTASNENLSPAVAVAVPPVTPPIPAIRHSMYTPSPPPPVSKPVRSARPITETNFARTNYMNLDLPVKVPPKKPARSSVGILLDRVDVSSPSSSPSSSPRKEASPSVDSGRSTGGSTAELPAVGTSPVSDRSPPPLPDRNYYDEAVAGDYACLRFTANKRSTDDTATTDANKPYVLPTVTHSGLASSHVFPEAPGVPHRPSVPSRHHNVYNPHDNNHHHHHDDDDDACVVSPKEDISELRRQTVQPDIVGPTSPHSESFYEDLSEAYSGDVNLHVPATFQFKLHAETVPHDVSTIGSSTCSDLDLDVYELLSEATTGRTDECDAPSGEVSQSLVVEPAHEDFRQTDVPVPPRRRFKHPSKDSPKSPLSVKPLDLAVNNNNQNGTAPSRLDGYPASEEDDTSVNGYRSQPSTPDHPPPSPHTAKLGIQAKLSPQSFPSLPRHDTTKDRDHADPPVADPGMADVNTSSDWDQCYDPPCPKNGSPAMQRRLYVPNHKCRVRGRYSYGYRSHDEPAAAAAASSVTDTSSCRGDDDADNDAELLRPDEDDPFAGLIYGSNRGSRNLFLETTSRLSLSHMADWSRASSARTSVNAENGYHGDGAGRCGGERGPEDQGGAMDENSEWAQIESIMASFGAGLVRESVYIRDFQKEFEKMFEGPSKPQSVGSWLDRLGVGQYENMLIANGFDNLDFMGGNILEESDQIEMGITEEIHRKIILQATNALPVMKTINDVMPNSVSDWLRGLLLNDCVPNFIDNGITTMDRAKELWELELKNVLEVHMLGHRKRIVASLGDRRHSYTRGSNIARPDSLDLTTNDLELNLSDFEKRKQILSPMLEQSASLDIDLFKDYTKEVTTPTPRPTPTEYSPVVGGPCPPPTPPHRNGIQPGLPPARQSRTKRLNSGEAEDYDNVDGPTGRTEPIGPSADGGAAVSPPPLQWMHAAEVLIKGCCNYTASYLGSTLVKDARGVDSTQESCTRLRRSASHLQKIPSITLSISYMGVKFIDFKSKMIITDHEICNISCVTQDTDDHKTFAYITKDSENDKMYCHVFSVRAEEISTEIILTLGQAFEIAYQMLLKTSPRSLSNDYARHRSNTSENDCDTKL